MSLENNIERIATSLERIANALDNLPTREVVSEAYAIKESVKETDREVVGEIVKKAVTDVVKGDVKEAVKEAVVKSKLEKKTKTKKKPVVEQEPVETVETVTLTVADIKEQLMSLSKVAGRDVAKTVLEKFNAEKISQVDDKDYIEFVQLCYKSTILAKDLLQSFDSIGFSGLPESRHAEFLDAFKDGIEQ